MASDHICDNNTLDFSAPAPGDILLVANPTDMAIIRYLIFWSHVGIVSTQGDVIDAVREPRGDYDDSAVWYQVRRSPLSFYQKCYDVLAIHPRLPEAARHAAASYAGSKVGAPYAANMRMTLFGRHEEKGYSCASLMWQAYKKQGLDLAPVPSWCGLNVLPLILARDAQVEVVGRGTRYASVSFAGTQLRRERWYFRNVLGADIMIDR